VVGRLDWVTRLKKLSTFLGRDSWAKARSSLLSWTPQPKGWGYSIGFAWGVIFSEFPWPLGRGLAVKYKMGFSPILI